MTTRLSSVFRTTEADSPASRLAACDESLSLIAADVDQLTEQLDRVREGASPLVQWLSERDAVLAEKELELARLQDEQLLALRRADDATAALRETRDLLQDHDGRVTTATLELDDLRNALAERDAVLAEKELELARLRDEQELALRRADDATAALRETRDLLQDHDGRVTETTRELDDLRDALAERDRALEHAESARARLDEALAEREVQLVQERAAVAVLQTRVIIAADPVAAEEEDRVSIAGHVGYAPFPEGYRLVTSDEECPLAGDVVDVDGHSFLVTRVGRSPLPADTRPCAFLQRRTIGL